MNVAHQLLDFQSHFYTEGHFRPHPVRAIRVSRGGLELSAINNRGILGTRLMKGVFFLLQIEFADIADKSDPEVKRHLDVNLLQSAPYNNFTNPQAILKVRRTISITLLSVL